MRRAAHAHIYTHVGARNVTGSTEVIRRLEREGWIERRVAGSHHIFGRAGTPFHVTVPHPKRDLPIGTLRAIHRQAGWEWPPR